MNDIDKVFTLYIVVLPLFYLKPSPFISFQNAIPEVIHHERQSFSQRNFWLPVQQLLCFADIWFPLMWIISSVGSEFYCCTWINSLFDNLHYTEENWVCQHKLGVSISLSLSISLCMHARARAHTHTHTLISRQQFSLVWILARTECRNATHSEKETMPIFKNKITIKFEDKPLRALA